MTAEQAADTVLDIVKQGGPLSGKVLAQASEEKEIYLNFEAWIFSKGYTRELTNGEVWYKKEKKIDGIKDL